MARTVAGGTRRCGVLVGLALGVFGLGACGGDEDARVEPSEPVEAAAPVESAAPAATAASGPRDVDPASTGGLSGRVLLSGPAPAPALLPVVGDAFCVGLAGDAGLPDEALVVSDGGVGGAFVHVVAGLDDWRFPDDEGVVEIDQRGCVYHPRVVGLRTGQTLRLLNSDPVLHNVHTHPKLNREKNLAMPPDTGPRDLEFKREEVMVEMACDVHAWMKSWIGVLDHPGFAVTDAQGRWTIEGLPPGDYELEVWHERLGTRRVKAAVSAGQVAALGDESY